MSSPNLFQSFPSTTASTARLERAVPQQAAGETNGCAAREGLGGQVGVPGRRPVPGVTPRSRGIERLASAFLREGIRSWRTSGRSSWVLMGAGRTDGIAERILPVDTLNDCYVSTVATASKKSMWCTVRRKISSSRPLYDLNNERKAQGREQIVGIFNETLTNVEGYNDRDRQQFPISCAELREPWR